MCKAQLLVLIPQCVKTKHVRNKCKCDLIIHLQKEIENIETYVKSKKGACLKEWQENPRKVCSKLDRCVSCIKKNRYKCEQEYISIKLKKDLHTCICNWDYTSKSMEGGGACELITDIPKKTNA